MCVNYIYFVFFREIGISIYVYMCMHVYISIYTRIALYCAYRGSALVLICRSPVSGLSFAPQGGDHVILRKVKEPVCLLDQTQQ